VSPPQGALCSTHPDRGATSVCTRCGSFSCPACTVTSEDGLVRCARCATLTPHRVLADAGSRFAANLVDHLFVVLVPVLGAGVFGIVGALLGARLEDRSGVLFVVMVLGTMGLFFAACAVQLWLQVQRGQSLGKRLLSIRVLRSDGSPVELWRIILLRNVLTQILSQMCGVIGLVDALMIFGQERRCLHDLLADTIVVVSSS
jgi:uncharacterized RDD family membrane protein YckC